MCFTNSVRLVVFGMALVSSGPALGDVVGVVSAKSRLTALTKEQAMDIFLGKANRFPDGSPAVPIDQIGGSPVRDEFYFKFGGKSSAELKTHWSRLIFTGRGQPPIEAANSVEVKRRLVENPSAIGYVERSVVDPSIKIVLQ